MGTRERSADAGSRLHYIHMNRSVREAATLLSRPDLDALVVIDGERAEEGAIVGLITERDVFRAIATEGLDVLDNLVWMLARNDFVTVDVRQSYAHRLEQFCAHRAEYVAVMDGCSLLSVQSIWDCVGGQDPGAGAKVS